MNDQFTTADETLLEDAERPSHYKEFTATISEPPPGTNSGPDVVATITCATIDEDAEIVMPDGADLSRFRKNPVVMLNHAMGRPGEYYPLPVAKALWIKRKGDALIAGVWFSRKTPMAQQVRDLYAEGIMAGFSIGFRSLDASRPTTDELAKHPAWRGVHNIHRRWKLLEFSCVPIPCNEDAIGQYVSKGKSLPSFLWVPPAMSITTKAATAGNDKPKPMEDGHSFLEGAHVRCKGMGCGMIKSLHPDGVLPEDAEDGRDEDSRGEASALVAMHDDKCMPSGKVKGMACKDLEPMGDGDDDADDEAKALSGASGTGGGYTDEPAHGDPNRTEPPNPDQSGDDADFDDDDDEPEPIRKGDRVSFGKGATHPPGVGVVKSIHTSGKVPGCVNHAMASEEMPHARVKLYKSMDHPFHYHETDDHAAVPVTNLKRLETLTYTPSGKGEGAKAVVAAKGERSITMHSIPHVPPFRTEAQWEAAIVRQARDQLATERPDTLAQDVMDRVLGTI